jgi:hypothetical protein
MILTMDATYTGRTAVLLAKADQYFLYTRRSKDHANYTSI